MACDKITEMSHFWSSEPTLHCMSSCLCVCERVLATLHVPMMSSNTETTQFVSDKVIHCSRIYHSLALNQQLKDAAVILSFKVCQGALTLMCSSNERAAYFIVYYTSMFILVTEVKISWMDVHG